MFGSEDVDLRLLAPPPQIAPPAPILVPSNVPEKSNVKSSLDAVRAKLAEVSKSATRKMRSRDVDLRHMDILDDDSQDGEAKLKMLLMQANEQVETENLDKEQIQTMVQQMIQIKNETQAREEYKRYTLSQGIRRSAEVAFSSDSENEELKQSHRVPPKRSRSPTAPSVVDIDTPMHGKDTTVATAKGIDVKAPRDRRQRKSKWSAAPAPNPLVHPMTQAPPSLMSNLPFPMNVPSMALSQNGWPPNFMPFNTVGMGNGAPAVPPFMLPPNQLPNTHIVMAQHGNVKSVIASKERTINIDSVPREIRFYDEVAIAFMDDHFREPKEIGFQAGDRRLCVDDKDSITLSFNDTYKPFIIDGKTYQIRFGSPTRELYINNEWYECYFGEPPVGIYLENKLRVFKIDGPPPQVRIGNLRKDLVAGRVDMYVDSITKVPLYLDAQVQTFAIENQMHTIQFADYFLTAIIDNVPFPVKYGEMPTKFQLKNSEHYIRFSVLPSDMLPGKVYVRNMVRTNLQRDLKTPPLDVPVQTIEATVGNITSTTVGLNNAQINEPMSSAASTTSAPASATTPNLAGLNINELLQKLVASGVLGKSNTESNETKATEQITPVLLSKPETLKKRQAGIVHALFSGMQCSSCGVRFPPGQTIKYNQHLDWHYRQNRRERDSARRAHSRKWYYEVSDWIQYEEIENLDEREKNWFETQQTEQDPTNDDSNQRTNSPLPSCVAGPDDDGKICDMCHDPFETFFHEETEEWHLRNAIRVDNHVYHPICYEDYKVSRFLH